MNFLFIWRFNCRLLVSFCYRCLFLLFTCVSVSWSWHDLWPDGPWDVEGNVRLLFGGNLFFFCFSGDFSTFLDEMWRVHVRRLLLMFVYICGEKKLVTIQTSCCKKKKTQQTYSPHHESSPPFGDSTLCVRFSPLPSPFHRRASLLDFYFDHSEERPLEAFEDIFASYENKK